MGNQPQKPHSQPVRPSSLPRKPPPPITLDKNNRLLNPRIGTPPLMHPPTLKAPSNLNLINPPQLLIPTNPNPNLSNNQLMKKSTTKPQIQTTNNNNNIKETENRILDSESISSYHFQTENNPPEKNTQKMADSYKKPKPKQNKPIFFDNEKNDDNLDPLSKMRAYLMKKAKKDLHLRFFRENLDLMFISLPILNRKKAKLVPFRNMLCEKPECLYDIEDLLHKYRESMFSNYLTFLCFNCKQVLDLSRFYLDFTLNQIIGEIFQRYNKTTIQCKMVTILRTGQWEPSLPEYLKLLDRNIAKTQEDARRIANVDEAPELKPAKKKQKIPDFKDFKNEEFKELEASLLKKTLKPDKKIISFPEFSLTNQDYQQLKSESAFTTPLMSFFLRYIEEYQQRNLETFNKDNGNRTFAIGIKVLKFDRFYKRAKYQYIPGSINFYKGKARSLMELFNLISVMVFIESRWVVLLVDLNTFDYYPVDFLQEGISNISLTQISDFAQYFMRKEFNISLKKLKFFHNFK